MRCEEKHVFGFVKALTNKRSETVKEAMVDMQLLWRGVWRFHSDEGREFMSAVDNWLREHAVLHTTTGAYDPNTNSLIEESVSARKSGNSMSPASSKRTSELVARRCGTRKRSLQSQQTTSTWTERHGGTDRVGETCLFGTRWMRRVSERETKLVATLGLSGICK